MSLKQWEAPMAFRKTETGGYCAPGCHAGLGYDRANPVVFDEQHRLKAPAPARARTEERLPVRLTATDTRGREVNVPGKRLTAIAAWREDLEQTQKTIQPLLAALTSQASADVVLLVGGRSAAESADKVEVRIDRPWHVVLDATDELARSLGISAWPTVVLAEPDGREVARFAGPPVTLALRLGGYLDQNADSAGKLKVHTVGNGARRVNWYLQLAQTMRKNGQAEQAEKVLREALAQHPGEEQISAGLGQVLLQLDRPQQALDALPADAASPQAQLVRGQALIRLQQWDEARTLTQKRVQDHPNLRDSHYLMGQIHEHFQQWQLAAESYRAARP